MAQLILSLPAGLRMVNWPRALGYTAISSYLHGDVLHILPLNSEKALSLIKVAFLSWLTQTCDRL